MAIKADYKFSGITIPNATIKVIRIFGSSKEGWNSLVGVYNTTTEIVPAIEEVVENGIVVIEAQPETTADVLNLIEEFNHPAEFDAEKRGYESVYESLMAKYGGVKI